MIVVDDVQIPGNPSNVYRLDDYREMRELGELHDFLANDAARVAAIFDLILGLPDHPDAG